MFRLATCDFFSRGLGLRHCGRGSAAPCGRRLRPCGRPRQKTHLAAVFFFTLAPLPRLALRPAPAARAARRPLGAQARRLHLEHLAAVELHRVAPLALVLKYMSAFFSGVIVEVGGDAALAVHVRTACAVDHNSLVHQGGALRVVIDG